MAPLTDRATALQGLTTAVPWRAAGAVEGGIHKGAEGIFLKLMLCRCFACMFVCVPCMFQMSTIVGRGISSSGTAVMIVLRLCVSTSSTRTANALPPSQISSPVLSIFHMIIQSISIVSTI